MRLKRAADMLVLLTVACCLVAAQTGPIAMDRFSQKQKLYLLDENGRILVSDAKQLDGPTRLFATVPSVLKAIDLLSTKLWTDREQIYVTAYGLTQADTRSRIIQYSSLGERQCEWMLPEVSSGLDVDPDQHAIYLSGSATGSLYRLKLIKDSCYGPKQLNQILSIRSAEKLGPIVIDRNRRLAFVADVLRGSVYRVNLDMRSSIEVTRSLGQPAGLLYDESLERLYAVDSAGRRIWQMNVTGNLVPTPLVIAQDKAFQEPVSITFAADGGLLVCDRVAKVLFSLNLSGRVTRQFPMPN